MVGNHIFYLRKASNCLLYTSDAADEEDSGLKRPIVSYLKLLLVHLCLTIVGYIGSLKVMEYFLPMIDGLHKWVYWITQASLFTVIISCFTITLYYITLSHFRAFVYRIVKIKFP